VNLKGLLKKKIGPVPVPLAAAVAGLLVFIVATRRRQQTGEAAPLVEPRSSQPQAQYQLPQQGQDSSGGMVIVYPPPTAPGTTEPLPPPPPPAPPPAPDPTPLVTLQQRAEAVAPAPVQTSYGSAATTGGQSSQQPADEGGTQITTVSTEAQYVPGGGNAAYGDVVSTPAYTTYDPALGYDVTTTGSRFGSGPAID